MSFLQTYPYIFQQSQLFNHELRLSLSKQRIIQKNLVHFQGFPDSLYNENLLLSPEYLGQYGSISKIVLVSKEDKKTHKKINSAYITFETKEQAAYCILSIDSIKIDDNIVRAFFGTTKYCNHFINNYRCFNEEKCMFLHHIAEPSDIIDENTKFGYNDHIKLAKKIISYGSPQSKYYIFHNNFFNKKTILPNIKTIYDKGESDSNNINHRRNLSNLSNNSTSNNSSNRSNNLNSSKSSTQESEKIDENNSNENIIDENNLNCSNDCNFDCFKSEKKSRFFNNINNENNLYDTYESKNIIYIVNNLCKRMSFFNYSKNNNQTKLLKELEINYCINLYKKTNDNEIKLLLEQKF